MPRRRLAVPGPERPNQRGVEEPAARSGDFEALAANVRSPGSSRRPVVARFAELGERRANSTVQNAPLRRAAFDAMPAAQAVLDPDDKLLLATELSRRMFALTNADLGRPIKNLKLFTCPVEFEKHLQQIRQERRPIEIKRACWCDGTEERVLDVRIVPLSPGGELVGTSVSYKDVTDLCGLERQFEEIRHGLERACYELGPLLEQFEIQLEEQRAMTAEVEVAYERLLSAHEELERTNTELQSARQELAILSAELHRRANEPIDAALRVVDVA